MHLGKAVGEFRKVGPVYLREFQDGWAVTNPSPEDAAGIAVPHGRARVINHGALRTPEAAVPVTHFDLHAHRGIILLKEGRQIGNADNH